jgi:hypothetical protein
MRVFNVTPAADGATISRLTIRDGTVSGLPTNQTAVGAGILNEGRLTLNDCTLANHRVIGMDGAAPGAFGGSAGGRRDLQSGKPDVESLHHSRLRGYRRTRHIQLRFFLVRRSGRRWCGRRDLQPRREHAQHFQLQFLQ